MENSTSDSGNTVVKNSLAKYEIEVEGKKCLLKSLDRGTLEVALGHVMPTNGQPQYLRAGEIILKSCWLEGDKAILENEELMIAACMQAYQLIEMKTATLKKL